jgi:hypothetical protein
MLLCNISRFLNIHVDVNKETYNVSLSRSCLRPIVKFFFNVIFFMLSLLDHALRNTLSKSIKFYGPYNYNVWSFRLDKIDYLEIYGCTLIPLDVVNGFQPLAPTMTIELCEIRN